MNHGSHKHIFLQCKSACRRGVEHTARKWMFVCVWRSKSVKKRICNKIWKGMSICIIKWFESDQLFLWFRYKTFGRIELCVCETDVRVSRRPMFSFLVPISSSGGSSSGCEYQGLRCTHAFICIVFLFSLSLPVTCKSWLFEERFTFYISVWWSFFCFLFVIISLLLTYSFVITSGVLFKVHSRFCRCRRCNCCWIWIVWRTYCFGIKLIEKSVGFARSRIKRKLEERKKKIFPTDITACDELHTGYGHHIHHTENQFFCVCMLVLSFVR